MSIDGETPPAEVPEGDAPGAASEPKAPTKEAEPKSPPLREQLRSLGAWIRDHYGTADPRTLGVFRLALGFLLTADCIRHWAEAPTFYSNEGVLTNHFHLFRPSSGYNFSVYHAFSTLPEVHLAFGLSCLCYFLFFLGYRTRLFSILSFVLVTSMDNRLVMIENGGYVVVNLAACWAMFMPTGRRFSVDALLQSYRERRERTAADLNVRYRPARTHEPFVSLVMGLAIVNLAFVYFFNVVNKSGQIWRVGDTVHYVLYLNRMVTGVAVFFRELLPYPITRGLSWAVLCLEALLFTWILSPHGRRVTRPLAIAGIWLLHGTFGIMMRLGPFSWFLMGWSSLLLTPIQWDGMERLYRKRARPLVVVYDASSPLAFAIGRLLSRLDHLTLLHFEPSHEDQRDPPLIEVRDGQTSLTGKSAFRAIVSALPGGRYVYPLLAIASLGLLGPIVNAASRHRRGISRFFGFAAPSRRSDDPGAAGSAYREGAESEPAAVPDEPTPSPLRRRLARYRVRSRELLLVFLAICGVWQALNENKAIPKEVKEYLKPPWIPEALYSTMTATIQTPRIFQGWGMFSPNPITEDGSVTIEAWTLDGRRIDPFTGQEPDLDLTDSDGLGLNQIRQDYFNRIRLDRNKAYRQGLRDYLMAYHVRTGNPGDELVAFDVYWVKAQCPKPGQDKPTDNKTIALLTYRKPGYKRPAEWSPIPPSPKVESAGN